jgi:hypothetical protein
MGHVERKGGNHPVDDQGKGQEIHLLRSIHQVPARTPGGFAKRATRYNQKFSYPTSFCPEPRQHPGKNLLNPGPRLPLVESNAANSGTIRPVQRFLSVTKTGRLRRLFLATKSFHPEVAPLRSSKRFIWIEAELWLSLGNRSTGFLRNIL